MVSGEITRAATSADLNIAEGPTGQTDAEQSRFLGLALRSLIETVACQHIIRRRKYLQESGLLDVADERSNALAKKLQTFRNSLKTAGYRIKEGDISVYIEDD